MVLPAIARPLGPPTAHRAGTRLRLYVAQSHRGPTRGEDREVRGDRRERGALGGQGGGNASNAITDSVT